MRIQYKLDPLGKVESFALLNSSETLESGFLIAESEHEFERTTGFDLSSTNLRIQYQQDKSQRYRHRTESSTRRRNTLINKS